MAAIRDRAGIAVRARRSVGFGGIAAYTRRGIASPQLVALIGSWARDGGSRARAALTAIGNLARIAVVTGSTIGERLIAAVRPPAVGDARSSGQARLRVADFGRSRACTSLAGVGFRAAIVVVAVGPIGPIGDDARPRPGLAGARLAFPVVIASALATHAIDAMAARAL